jgi:hypothetical protein
MQLEVISYNGTIASKPGKDRIVSKFLLIEHMNTLLMLIGEVDEFRYHAQLLDRFCSNRGIAASWVKRDEYLEVYDKSLRIRGGGWMEVTPEGQYARIYGSSSAYGQYETVTLRQIVDLHPFFEGIQVRIEN